MNDGRVRSIAVMLDSRWYMETRATRPFETANRSQRIYARVYIYIYISVVPQVESDRLDSRRVWEPFFPFFPLFFSRPSLASSNTRLPYSRFPDKRIPRIRWQF